MIHVGMDLHHRMAYVRAITDDAELLAGRKIYFNDMPRLWEYLDQFGDQPVRVVFEAISNSRWRYRLLRQRPNIEPVVVTPHKVKIIAETVSKTDKIDAAKLAWLSRVNMLPKAWMPDERFEALRECGIGRSWFAFARGPRTRSTACWFVAESSGRTTIFLVFGVVAGWRHWSCQK